MRIAIHGGHGFLGQTLAQARAQDGDDVVVVDLAAAPEGAPWEHLPVDLLDREAVRAHLGDQRFDATIFLVGAPNMRQCEQDPAFSLKLNVAALDSVLHALSRENLGHLVFASTAAVYGPGAPSPISEATPLAPRSVYGIHKAIAERLVDLAAASYDLDATVLRFFNVLGPGNAGIARLLVDSARGGPSVKVFGPDQRRDFVHVDDVAKVIELVLDQPARGARVLNVGTGKGFSIAELVAITEKAVPGVQWEPSEATGATYDAVADVTRLQEAVGLTPRMDEERLKRIIQEEIA